MVNIAGLGFLYNGSMKCAYWKFFKFLAPLNGSSYYS